MWQPGVLCHYGILGMKWGVRRFQNADGSLTEAGRKRLEKKDSRWADRNYNRMYAKAYKPAVREMKKAGIRELTAQRSKRLPRTVINQYNRALAELMNKHIGDVPSPSGRVVQFVAKRGEVGVHMALADRGYDIGQLRNGVWASGRIAYKKQSVEMQHGQKPDELCHFGVKGMKWGVRKDDLPGRDKYGRIEPIRLGRQEYAHVMSEVATHASAEQRRMDFFTKNIGNYIYAFYNNHNGTYDVLKKESIPGIFSGAYKEDEDG